MEADNGGRAQPPAGTNCAPSGFFLGAAFIAGQGLGVFGTWGDIERFIQLSDTVEPDPSTTARYDNLFGQYLELYLRNLDL